MHWERQQKCCAQRDRVTGRVLKPSFFLGSSLLSKRALVVADHDGVHETRVGRSGVSSNCCALHASDSAFG